MGEAGIDDFQRERSLRHEMLTLIFQDNDCTKFLGLYENDGTPMAFNPTTVAQIEKEAEAGSLVAQVMAGALLGAGIGLQSDEDKAKAWLLKAAKQGSGVAMTALGILYVYGKTSDAEVANQWFLKAGEANYTRAMTWLVNRYRAGRGTPVSETEAFKWCQRAAELGLVDAEFVLGTFYLEGYGTQKSKAKAEEWLVKAAEHKFPKAHLYLGHLYASGYFGPQDFAKAAKHFQVVAEEDPNACFNLARFYYEGKGVPQSDEKCLHYLKLAEEQGHDPALVMLGDAYLKGTLGLKLSPNKAVQYYRAAAEYGDYVPALMRLAICYRRGIGVKRSLPRAEEYAQLALSREKDDADPLNDMIGLF